MASFDLFLPIVLQFEGGYVDDPTDPGGETNKGITMATFQQCSHELLGLDPTSENLRALTDGQADESGLGYAPLPKAVADKALAELHTITSGGTPIWP